VTWEQYAAALDGNIDDLHGRIMRGGYRAKPSRRQYIPKPTVGNGRSGSPSASPMDSGRGVPSTMRWI